MKLPFPFEIKGNPEELPSPDQVISALVQFPPKLSVLQKIPALPESMFEKTVESATGVRPPPGPNTLALSIMESIEAAIPGVPAPTPTPAPAPSTQTQRQPQVSKVDVEVF